MTLIPGFGARQRCSFISAARCRQSTAAFIVAAAGVVWPVIAGRLRGDRLATDPRSSAAIESLTAVGAVSRQSAELEQPDGRGRAEQPGRRSRKAVHSSSTRTRRSIIAVTVPAFSRWLASPLNGEECRRSGIERPATLRFLPESRRWSPRRRAGRGEGESAVERHLAGAQSAVLQ